MPSIFMKNFSSPFRGLSCEEKSGGSSSILMKDSLLKGGWRDDLIDGIL
jgi:hypothetical protein